MTIASDNPFPSLLIVEGTAPSAPAASRQRLYFDSTTHLLKAINSAGTARTIESGGELDYVEFTAPVSVTHTTEGTADTVVTGGSVTYDGSTAIIIEFYSGGLVPQTTAAAFMGILLYEDATLLGIIAQARAAGSSQDITPCLARRKRTPAAGSHTYTIKATTSSGTSVVNGGTGGSGNYVAGYLRITRV